MQLRTQLGTFLAGVLYPLWLLGGALDYLCHRKTKIADTSGPTESWLHVAELLCVAVIITGAVLFEITRTVLVLMALAVVAHTALSFLDVSYTLGRRHISTLEQHVHGLLNVIPAVAVCLLAILNWDSLQGSPGGLLLKQQPLSVLHRAALLGSFAVLAGIPVFEELLRTQRARGTNGSR